MKWGLVSSLKGWKMLGYDTIARYVGLGMDRVKSAIYPNRNGSSIDNAIEQSPHSVPNPSRRRFLGYAAVGVGMVLAGISLYSLLGCGKNNEEIEKQIAQKPIQESAETEWNAYLSGMPAPVSAFLNIRPIPSPPVSAQELEEIAKKISLVGHIENYRGNIKNIYITNEEGDVLYTLMENEKTPENMKKYMRLHISPIFIFESKDGQVKQEGGEAEYRFGIESPIPAIEYYLVAEDEKGNIKIDADTHGTDYKKEVAEKIIQKLKRQNKIGSK